MGVSDGILRVVVVFSLLVQLHKYVVAADHDHGNTLTEINIGVFVDTSSRIGKEQKVGMIIAAEDFNNNQSQNIRLKLQFLSSNTSNPLQAAYSAIKLAKEKKTEVIIIGTYNSEEETILEEIGNQYKLPILSLSTAAPKSKFQVKNGNSFLVRMANDYSSQINCTKSLIDKFGWKKVIAVYEDGEGSSTSTSSILDEFSQALQDQDVDILVEYRLALPPFALMSNPKEMITDELVKVFNMESRIFVVLHASLPMTIQLFKEAHNMGLVGRETAWIVTDSISSLFDTLNSSTKSHMQGALGVKTYYHDFNQNFRAFERQFLLNFMKLYPEEDSFHPGSHALRAYDAITTVGKAFQRLKLEGNNISMSRENSLREITSTNFIGLSGNISFKNGALETNDMVYKIINVIGKSYKELNYWSQNRGFFERLSDDDPHQNSSAILAKTLNGMVNWPADIRHVPKGWTMPSTAKPLKIGLPGRPPFDNFVMVENMKFPNRNTYTGFCVDVFLEAVKIVEQSYGVTYEFELFDGTYDELVDRVFDKTYDLAVGDVTINANRSKFVEFTQPYTKSGLSMIVPLRSKESQKELMFMRPFSWQLWLVSLVILLYTMFAVWWIESRNTSNDDFHGGWINQLNIALWFTFSSLFFAQKENIKSNLTRIVVITWLFVVFVLISSYSASLTSMLTVPLLEPTKVRDVKWLKETNSPIGCDGGSVWDYLVNELGFSPKNIVNVTCQYDYQTLFFNGSIVAAFLERPYQRLLVNQYCESFTFTKESFAFGGQGFVFQKGSPIVGDISKAILKISENGVLKELEDKWFPIAYECTTSADNHEVERLNPREFLVLYLIHGTISVSCFVFYIVRRIRRYQATVNTTRDRNFWNWIITFALYIHGRNNRNSRVTPDIELTDTIQNISC